MISHGAFCIPHFFQDRRVDNFAALAEIVKHILPVIKRKRLDNGHVFDSEKCRSVVRPFRLEAVDEKAVGFNMLV